MRRDTSFLRFWFYDHKRKSLLIHSVHLGGSSRSTWGLASHFSTLAYRVSAHVPGTHPDNLITHSNRWTPWYCQSHSFLLSSSKGVSTQVAVESEKSQIYVMIHSIPERSVYFDYSWGVLLRFYGSFCKASNSVRFWKFYAYWRRSAHACTISTNLGP